MSGEEGKESPTRLSKKKDDVETTDKIMQTDIGMNYFDEIQSAIEAASPELAKQLSDISPLPRVTSEMGGVSHKSSTKRQKSNIGASARHPSSPGREADPSEDFKSHDSSENMSPGLRAAGPIHGDIIQEEDDDADPRMGGPGAGHSM